MYRQGYTSHSFVFASSPLTFTGCIVTVEAQACHVPYFPISSQREKSLTSSSNLGLEIHHERGGRTPNPHATPNLLGFDSICNVPPPCTLTLWTNNSYCYHFTTGVFKGRKGGMVLLVLTTTKVLRGHFEFFVSLSA